MLGPAAFQVGHLWMCFTPAQKHAELQLNLDKFCLVSFSLCVCGLQTNRACTAGQSFSTRKLNKLNIIWNSPLFLVYSRWDHCHIFIYKKKKFKRKSLSQHVLSMYRLLIVPVFSPVFPFSLSVPA